MVTDTNLGKMINASDKWNQTSSGTSEWRWVDPDDGCLVIRKVFMHTIIRYPEMIYAGLETNGLVMGDVTQVLPHKAVAAKLNMPEEQVFSNTTYTTTTVTLSIALCIAAYTQQKNIPPTITLSLLRSASVFCEPRRPLNGLNHE